MKNTEYHKDKLAVACGITRAALQPALKMGQLFHLTEKLKETLDKGNRAFQSARAIVPAD
ncbi:MAG: hypothetical protein ACLRY6_06800 [[Clostridium] innocuum]